MGTMSRNKGARAEREVLQHFKTHFGGTPWRRSGVGFEGKDLLTPDDFRFSTEIKDHKDARVRWFFHPTEKLLSWWQQALDQAASDNRLPLLVMKAESAWYAMWSDSSLRARAGVLPAVLKPGTTVKLATLPTFFECYATREAPKKCKELPHHTTCV
jgi:Holliday junction resolvase